MTMRKSIYVDTFPHANPTPAACLVGNMVFSAVIYGREPASQQVPVDMDLQCQYMFEHVRTIVEAAGGSLDNIVKMTLWMVDKQERDIVNRHWLSYFPDPSTRPARHTQSGEFTGNIRIQCDFIAVL